MDTTAMSLMMQASMERLIAEAKGIRLLTNRMQGIEINDEDAKEIRALLKSVQTCEEEMNAVKDTITSLQKTT